MKFYIFYIFFGFLSTLSQENTILIVGKDIMKYDQNLGRFNLLKINHPKDFNPHNYSCFKFENRSILLNNRSGMLYEIINDSVVRIDKSYDDRIHSRSLNFSFNDTLYKFGGYGYYHAHKLLTYYDKTTKEWDLVKYKGHGKIDGFSFDGIHFIKENKLYVLGLDIHKNEFQNVSNFKNEGFIYDINKKTVTKKFKVSIDFRYPDNYFLLKDKYVFLFYKSDRKIIIYDLENELFYKYNLNQKQSQFLRKSEGAFTDLDDTLFFVCKDNDQVFYINDLNINDVMLNMDSIEFEIIDQNKEVYIIYFCFIILIFILVYPYFKQNKKIILSKNLVIIDNHKIDIDIETFLILSRLNKERESTNSELNKIFDDKNLNRDHINRTKNEKIKEINIRFKSIIGREIILKKKSSVDKRMTIFLLNNPND